MLSCILIVRKWQYGNSPTLKYIYTIPKPIILVSQTDRFATPKGMY